MDILDDHDSKHVTTKIVFKLRFGHTRHDKSWLTILKMYQVYCFPLLFPHICSFGFFICPVENLVKGWAIDK